MTIEQKMFIFFINTKLLCHVFLQTLDVTRKCRLCGYILGVLTHTTAWDQLWGGDETLKWVSIYASQLCLPSILMHGSCLCLGSWTQGVWGWPRMHIFHSWHLPRNFCKWHFVIRLQKLELVFRHMDKRNGRTDGMDGQTDVEVEIVI